MAKASDFTTTPMTVDQSVLSGVSGTVTLDLSNAKVFEVAPSGDFTLDVTGLPQIKRALAYVKFVNGGDYVFQASNKINSGRGILPKLSPYINEYAGLSTFNQVNTFTPGVSSSPGVAFKPDGTKMYVVGYDNTAKQFSLSTAWDLSTATEEKSVGFNNYNRPHSLRFNSDGTRIIGVEDDVVFQFDLSTAWDFGTLTNSTDFQHGYNSAKGLISGDGKFLYVFGDNNDMYELSTPFDIGSRTKIDTIPSLEATHIWFNGAGDILYMQNYDSVYTQEQLKRKRLRVPFDIRTVESTEEEIDIDFGSGSHGIVGDNNKKIYIVDNNNDVREFDVAQKGGYNGVDVAHLVQISDSEVVIEKVVERLI